MTMINSKDDAIALRRYLESRVREFAASGIPISGIGIGYEVSQSGWVYVNADTRKQHARDGEWTSGLDNDPLLEMSHWVETDPGEAGQFILKIIQSARADGVFSPLKQYGPVQLDIEDFDGSWAWPAYEELGKSNLA